MQNYFKRQIELWGEDTQKELSSKSIAIVGAGGLGSSLAFALGATGIKEIHIVDFDEINIHNIHRQIAFKLDDIKKNKAVVNAKIIMQRSNFTQAIPHNCNFKEWIEKKIEVDLIIDATDNLQTRCDINNYAKKISKPWIYGSVEDFYGQVCFFKNSSFNDAFKITSQKPKGITPPMVMHISSLQATLALRYLANLNVKKDLLYYIFFNNDGELVTQKFNLPKN